MNTQSPDTQAEAEQVQISLIRTLSTAQKMARVRSLSESVIKLSRRAIKRAHPGLDEKELICSCVAFHYGPQLADRLRTFLTSRP